MNSKVAIEIRAVSNGFIVREVPNSNAVSFSDDYTHVFETMESLQRFVKQHFEPTKQLEKPE